MAENEENKSDFWSGLGAGSYSAANAALMGLPDFLVEKVAGSKTYDELQKYRAQNKMASDIGGVVGTVGSMFIPGGAIAKGVGLGAKAISGGKLGGSLLKAGEYMANPAGQGLIKNIAKAGAQSAEQSLVRNALDVSKNEDGTEKDIGQRLNNFGTETVLGGLLGGTAGTALSKLTGGFKSAEKLGTTAKKYFEDELADTATIQGLRSKGFETQDLTRYFGQSKIKRGKGSAQENEAEKLNKLANQYELNGTGPTEEAVTNAYKDKWNFITDAATTVDPKAAKKILDKLDIPESVTINKDSLMNARLDLSNKIAKYWNSSNITDVEIVEKLRKAKDLLDDQIIKLGNVPKELVAEAKAMKPLADLIDVKRARALKEASKGNEGLGSNTQIKTAIERGLTTGGLGAAAGYATGDEENRLQNALTYGVGGALGGAALQKLLGSASGSISRGLSKEVADKLTPEAIEKLSTKGQEAVELLGKKPGILGDTRDVEQMITQGAARSPALVDDATKEDVQAEAQAKVITDPKYQATIQANLEQIYNTQYSDMDPNDFMAMVKEKTNNFDPLNSYTARTLFGGDKAMGEQYLKDVQSLSGLKSYKKEGLDIPFLGDNKNDKAVLKSLTTLLTRDTKDLITAEKEAKKYLKLMKDGTLTPQQVSEILTQDKIKYMNDLGVSV